MRDVAMVVGALLLLGGCDRMYGDCYGDNEEAEAVVEELDGEIVLDWEFGTAYAISVYELDGDRLGRSMWHVQCGGDNLENDDQLEEQVCIRTPIAYGEEVRSPYFDSVGYERPKQLVPGVRYQAILSTLIEDDEPPPPPEPSVFSALVGWLPERQTRDDPRCGRGYSAHVDFVPE